jgi:hypothetical protein
MKRGALPFVRRRSFSVVAVVFCSVMLMAIEIIKVMKKQRRSKKKSMTEEILCRLSGV